MKRLKEYIGYAIALFVLIGWGITIGIAKAQFTSMQKNIEDLHDMSLAQQELNGKILMYIEMDIKSE